MMIAGYIVAGMLLGAPAEEPVVSADFVALFDACEYRHTGGQYQDELFRYRLFLPRNLRPTERCPLLVWLPGKGEDGSDNEKNLKWLNQVLDDSAHIEKYRFFILAVQCPSGSPWSKHPDSEDDMVAVSHAIFQKTIKEQPIDLDRVYLSGVSAGSSAVWEMALRYPSLFAAVVPMASGGSDPSRASRLARIPIWAFHNREDSGCSSAGDEEMVAALLKAGGNVRLTLGWKFYGDAPEFSAGHDCWSMAMKYDRIMDWMLAQRRGAWICWTPPGHKPWKWWHVFGVPSAFLAIVLLAWFSERRPKGTETGPGPIKRG